MYWRKERGGEKEEGRGKEEERRRKEERGGKKTALIIHRIMEVSVTENSAIFQLQYLINTGD